MHRNLKRLVVRVPPDISIEDVILHDNFPVYGALAAVSRLLDGLHNEFGGAAGCGEDILHPLQWCR